MYIKSLIVASLLSASACMAAQAADTAKVSGHALLTAYIYMPSDSRGMAVPAKGAKAESNSMAAENQKDGSPTADELLLATAAVAGGGVGGAVGLAVQALAKSMVKGGNVAQQTSKWPVSDFVRGVVNSVRAAIEFTERGITAGNPL